MLSIVIGNELCGKKIVAFVSFFFSRIFSFSIDKIFLSHRYGSRLIPNWIPGKLFRLFLDQTTLVEEEKLILQQNYQLDENNLDEKYFLRSVDDPEKWASIEKELERILRQCADCCCRQGQITDEERREFFISGLFID